MRTKYLLRHSFRPLRLIFSKLPQILRMGFDVSLTGLFSFMPPVLVGDEGDVKDEDKLEFDDDDDDQVIFSML